MASTLEVLNAMRSLTWRERRVLMYRLGLDGYPPASLRDVGRELELPAEDIRQIEATAFKKLEVVLNGS